MPTPKPNKELIDVIAEVLRRPVEDDYHAEDWSLSVPAKVAHAVEVYVDTFSPGLVEALTLRKSLDIANADNARLSQENALLKDALQREQIDYATAVRLRHTEERAERAERDLRKARKYAADLHDNLTVVVGDLRSLCSLGKNYETPLSQGVEELAAAARAIPPVPHVYTPDPEFAEPCVPEDVAAAGEPPSTEMPPAPNAFGEQNTFTGSVGWPPELKALFTVSPP